MNQLDRFRDTIAAYSKHGWQLRRVLMCESTLGSLTASGLVDVEGIEPETTSIDALWFARPSHEGRVAWELRLISDTPYALFEAFEADCDEDNREETLREMQARLVDYASRS